MLSFGASLRLVYITDIFEFISILSLKQVQKSHTELYFKHLYGYILSLKFIKQRLGKFSVKEIYERSHKKCSNQSSNTRHQATQDSDNNTD